MIRLRFAPGDQIAALARRGYLRRPPLDDARVEHILWNLERVPYPLPHDSVDAVLMTEVFAHKEALDRIARVRSTLGPAIVIVSERIER